MPSLLDLTKGFSLQHFSMGSQKIISDHLAQMILETSPWTHLLTN